MAPTSLARTVAMVGVSAAAVLAASMALAPVALSAALRSVPGGPPPSTPSPSAPTVSADSRSRSAHSSGPADVGCQSMSLGGVGDACPGSVTMITSRSPLPDSGRERRLRHWRYAMTAITVPEMADPSDTRKSGDELLSSAGESAAKFTGCGTAATDGVVMAAGDKDVVGGIGGLVGAAREVAACALELAKGTPEEEGLGVEVDDDAKRCGRLSVASSGKASPNSVIPACWRASASPSSIAALEIPTSCTATSLGTSTTVDRRLLLRTSALTPLIHTLGTVLMPTCATISLYRVSTPSNSATVMLRVATKRNRKSNDGTAFVVDVTMEAAVPEGKIIAAEEEIGVVCIVKIDGEVVRSNTVGWEGLASIVVEYTLVISGVTAPASFMVFKDVALNDVVVSP